jgi:ferredoxin-NADP reductase
VNTIEVRLQAIRFEAEGIQSFEFRAPDEQELPAFAAGAHVDIHLSDGIVRSYSLCNPSHERHRYVVAVNKDLRSRGGSRQMHERLRVGSKVLLEAPRNNFVLDEKAEHTILIAGGIGITPLISMIERLEALGRSWELFYCARNRRTAAFRAALDRLAGARPDRVHFNFDQEPGGAVLDLQAVVACAPPKAHLYCCGPVPMLASFEEATSGLAREQVHVEYFSAKEAPAVVGGFTLQLARSEKTIQVEPGKTMLGALLAAGIKVPYSCKEGVCGACETMVLEGTPDHRDQVLTPGEQAVNDRVMVCCSGSKSETLVLDL